MVIRLAGVALLASALLASPLPPRSANRQEAMSDSRELATSAIQSSNDLSKQSPTEAHPLGAGRDTSATVVGDKHVDAVHRKAQETQCPSSFFVKVPGSYNYGQAKLECAVRGYTLPMPKSSSMQSNLQGCLTQDAVWLGLTDSQTESTFRWDDGTGTSLTTTGYTNWFTNEPNNSNNEE
jgi:hypothetical protein